MASRWIGLIDIPGVQGPFHWHELRHIPKHEGAVNKITGYAIRINSGISRGTIYPIREAQWKLHRMDSTAYLKCQTGTFANGKPRFKTVKVPEYYWGGMELIEYDGEPVVKKRNKISATDMFGVEYKVGDWFFHEDGLCQVREIGTRYMTIFQLSNKKTRNWAGQGGDYSNYAILNDDLLETANQHIVMKVLES